MEDGYLNIACIRCQMADRPRLLPFAQEQLRQCQKVKVKIQATLQRVLLATFQIRSHLPKSYGLPTKNRLRHFDPIGTEFVSEAGAGQPFAS